MHEEYPGKTLSTLKVGSAGVLCYFKSMLLLLTISFLLKI